MDEEQTSDSLTSTQTDSESDMAISSSSDTNVSSSGPEVMSANDGPCSGTKTIKLFAAIDNNRFKCY